MANYSFVVQSGFRPFSMDEMLKPLAIYKQSYDNSENAYVAL